MTKVTYLLGAGASYNALPIVNQIPAATTQLLNQLANEKEHLLAESGKISVIDAVIEKLNKIHDCIG